MAYDKRLCTLLYVDIVLNGLHFNFLLERRSAKFLSFTLGRKDFVGGKNKSSAH